MKNIEKEVVYVAELDADVDDVIAAEYLYREGALKCVVLDPAPKTPEGLRREQMLKEIGVETTTKMPNRCKYVFVGGALTKVANYIKMHHIDYLVMNGGFAGDNVVAEKDRLDKFKGKQTVQTFNFNCDVRATDAVLKSSKRQIKEIILVGKNVCHSIINTDKYLWNDKESLELLQKYHAKPEKRQHDMLACHEGLGMIFSSSKDDLYCNYEDLYPYNTGLKGNRPEWGSSFKKADKNPYRLCIVAVGYTDKVKQANDFTHKEHT